MYTGNYRGNESLQTIAETRCSDSRQWDSAAIAGIIHVAH